MLSVAIPLRSPKSYGIILEDERRGRKKCDSKEVGEVFQDPESDPPQKTTKSKRARPRHS